MIERTKVDGRDATVIYLDDNWTPVSAANATLVKVNFDDGEVRFGFANRESRFERYSRPKGSFRTDPRFHHLSRRADDEDGDWVTINGAHVMIKDGTIVKGPKELIGTQPKGGAGRPVVKNGSGAVVDGPKELIGTHPDYKPPKSSSSDHPDFSGTVKLPDGHTLTLSADRNEKYQQLVAYGKAEREKLPEGLQQALLKDGAGTKEYFTDAKGNYSKDRIEQFQLPVMSATLAGHESQDKPQITFVGGGPAAGKSTASDEAHQQMKDAVDINVDDIRTHAPEFGACMPDNMMGLNEELGDIRDNLISASGQLRYNMVIDGVGSHSSAASLKPLQDQGYRLSYVYVHRSVDDAQNRAADRPYMTKNLADMRILPAAMVDKSHNKARAEGFPALSSIANEVKVIDKSKPEFGNEGKVVFWRDESGVRVRDEEGIKRVENDGRTKIKIQ